MKSMCYVDGFNLYHAIDDLGLHHYKWVDLRNLCEVFCPANLSRVYYFSAIATWRQAESARHKEYIKALRSSGVICVLGKFKQKDRECFNCKRKWKDHEEKETDVNIALHILRDAFKDRFEKAIIISGDSDLAPAIRMVRGEFPRKRIKVIAPLGRLPSYELVQAAGGRGHGGAIKNVHIERTLFPRIVRDPTGRPVAARPVKYDPPRDEPA